jgi:outer membrane protein assembly factor BamB
MGKRQRWFDVARDVVKHGLDFTKVGNMQWKLAFGCLLGSAMLLQAGTLPANDWPRFRGPNGSGISLEAAPPDSWSDKQNLKWKTALPGPGSSSPIVLGDRIFVTCYTGYGAGGESGTPEQLQRHLICLDRGNGKIRWSQTIAGERRDDPYQGYLTQHGYASSTPVADADRVYAFFGKSGVVAFDLDGKQLWKTDVGHESGNRRWGSAASLALSGEVVIVNASEESQSIRALDRKTGAQVWKAEGAGLELAYGTPTVIPRNNTDADIVISCPGEVWGLNAQTGKLRWFAEHRLTGNVSPSIIHDEQRLYGFGGFQSSGSFALKLNGEGDITRTGTVWSSRNSSYVATPLLFDGHLYWISDMGQAFCTRADTGDLVYRERVPGLDASSRPVYASPVTAGGKIFVATRRSGVIVLPARPEFRILAQNQFANDDSDFNATPALGAGELILRSNQFLYCVAQPSKP